MKTLNQKIGQKGGAAVEFAIVLPFLVLLIFGAIEFGVLFYNKQVITNASREGARAGITGASEGTISGIVGAYCANRLINLNGNNPLPTENINIEVTGPDGQNDLTVNVNFINDLLFAQIIGINNTTVSAHTVMRMEPTSGS